VIARERLADALHKMIARVLRGSAIGVGDPVHGVWGSNAPAERRDEVLDAVVDQLNIELALHKGE
jgi:hypothetical protein